MGYVAFIVKLYYLNRNKCTEKLNVAKPSLSLFFAGINGKKSLPKLRDCFLPVTFSKLLSKRKIIAIDSTYISLSFCHK
jgi:hypothetical protein